MKRALLILSSLGLLCAIVVLVEGSLPSQMTQRLPDQQAIGVALLGIVLALPFLGVLDAILGVIAAHQRCAWRWRAAFIALAIITLPLYIVGSILSLMAASVDQDIGPIVLPLLYFSIVVFLAALVFALRPPAQPVAPPASVSHTIDSRPPRE